MKIVQHGKTYGTLCQCDSCYCTFRFVDKDIYVNYSAFSDTVTGYVRCPECDNKIIIKEKKI